MHKHRNRPLIILLMTGSLAVIPTMSPAADATLEQQASILEAADTYFHAVAAGDTRMVMSLTTADFRATTLEGQDLPADDLAAKWKLIGFEYGGVHGTAHLESATQDGKAVITLWSIDANADRQPEGMTSVHSVHRLVWVTYRKGLTARTGWKVASDEVIQAEIKR